VYYELTSLSGVFWLCKHLIIHVITSSFQSSVTSMVGCQVLAIDLRGHGDTVTTNEEDLSAETMARYLVVQTLCFSVKL
jgi:hypothetical protein